MAIDRERIGENFFTESFKNTLRDYYAYGFFHADDLPESYSTTVNNWKRLNNILHDRDFWNWADSPHGRLFVTADSRSAPMNLFQLVYLYCGFRAEDPGNFFGTLLALSPETMPVAPFSLPDPFEDHPAYEDFKRRTQGPHRKLTSAELKVLLMPDEEPFTGDHKKINRSLEPLQHLDILTDTGASNEKCWSLAPLTLRALLNEGSQADAAVRSDPSDKTASPADNADLHTPLPFATRFLHALDFFSQYLPLGTCGLFLMMRLKDNPHEDGDCVRFRHEYFVSALNDYLLIDLLSAMEKEQWLLVRDRHAIRRQMRERILFPLEIRVSGMNGRSYLMGYDPLSRNLCSLRLETIDDLELIAGTGANAPDKLSFLHESHTAQDIEHCRQMLAMTWGVSIPPGDAQTGNAQNAPVAHHVRIEFATGGRDSRMTYRLRRERRFGTLTAPEGKEHTLCWKGDVLDPAEMRPWLRTCYGAIRSVDGVPYDAQEELAGIDRITSEEETIPPGYANLIADRCKKHAEQSPAGQSIAVTGTPCTAHHLLFHEAFGIYYHLLGNWLTALLPYGEADETALILTEEIIRGQWNNVLEQSRELSGLFTEQLAGSYMESLLHDRRFFIPGFRLRILSRDSAGLRGNGVRYGEFLTDRPARRGQNDTYLPCFLPCYHAQQKTGFGMDLLPLSLAERRFLLSMFHESKCKLFFTPAEIEACRTLLSTDGTTPFPMDRIRAFDRFYTLRDIEHKDKAQVTFRRFLQGILERRPVQLTYKTSRGQILEGIWEPVDIEYSKRENTFHLIALRQDHSKMDAFSLSRIRSLTLTEGSFDLSDARARLKDLLAARDGGGRRVTLLFAYGSGLEDRILTEFSPWEKTCVLKKPSDEDGTGFYTLTISFLQIDEDEIIERLLSYGGHVRVLEKSIKKELCRRLSRQRELFFPSRTQDER